jgi:hypothetical protein
VKHQRSLKEPKRSGPLFRRLQTSSLSSFNLDNLDTVSNLKISATRRSRSYSQNVFKLRSLERTTGSVLNTILMKKYDIGRMDIEVTAKRIFNSTLFLFIATDGVSSLSYKKIIDPAAICVYPLIGASAVYILLWYHYNKEINRVLTISRKRRV